MRAVSTVLAALVIPFVLLNLLGGIVGGLWLAILGEWSAIFLGLAIFFFGAFAASLMLLPGIAVGGIGAIALQKGNSFIGWSFLLLASPWTFVVIVGWEVGIFVLFGNRFTNANMIPMWLWSYGAATGVWSFMASKEDRNGEGGGAVLAAFASQIAYIVLSVCVLWLGWSIRDGIVAMLFPMMIALLLALMTAALTAAARRRLI